MTMTERQPRIKTRKFEDLPKEEQTRIVEKYRQGGSAHAICSMNQITEVSFKNYLKKCGLLKQKGKRH